MASLVIRTRPITREKLAQFFPDNHQLVRLLETLTQDVTVNIPDAVAPTIIVSDEGADLAQTAHSLAVAAQAIAREALALSQQINDGPPPVPVVFAVDPMPPVAPILLPDGGDSAPPPAPILLPDSDDLTARLSALRDRLAIAERAIAELKEGPAP